MLSAADLLQFLSVRGGQEYAVRVTPRVGGKGGNGRELGEYRLTVRGEEVRATGPSGQTRHLSAQTFTAIFGAYLFTHPAPTGALTDLGPLFSPEAERDSTPGSDPLSSGT